MSSHGLYVACHGQHASSFHCKRLLVHHLMLRTEYPSLHKQKMSRDPSTVEITRALHYKSHVHIPYMLLAKEDQHHVSPNAGCVHMDTYPGRYFKSSSIHTCCRVQRGTDDHGISPYHFSWGLRYTKTNPPLALCGIQSNLQHHGFWLQEFRRFKAPKQLVVKIILGKSAVIISYRGPIHRDHAILCRRTYQNLWQLTPPAKGNPIRPDKRMHFRVLWRDLTTKVSNSFQGSILRDVRDFLLETTWGKERYLPMNFWHKDYKILNQSVMYRYIWFKRFTC